MSDLWSTIGSFIGGSDSSSGPGTLVPMVSSSAQSLWQKDMTSDMTRDVAKLNENAAVRAYNREVDAYRNRYQWTTEDMRLSGLNPIMAATGGFSVTGAPKSSAAFTSPSSWMPEYSGWANAAKGLAEAGKAVAETKLKGAETEESRSRTMLNFQKVNESIAEIAKKRSEQGVMDAQERVLNQEMFNLEKDFELKVKAAEKMIAETRQAEAAGALDDKRREEIGSHMKVLDAQAKQVAFTLSELSKTAKVYEGPAGQAISYVKEIMSALNIGVGAFLKIPTGGR